MYPRISWSSLNAFEECNMRHKLNRERKRAPIPASVVTVGNVLHYVSEQLITNQRHDYAAVIEQAERDFDRRVLEAETLGWSAEEVQEKRDRVTVGAGQLVNLYTQHFIAGPAYKAELHILKFYEGWSLEGYLDVTKFAKDGDQVWVDEVWDVKSGGSKNGQLHFYSVLCEAYFGRRPESLGFIEPLARGMVPIGVTDDQHMAMKQRIFDAVTAIRNDEFPTSGFPSKCGWCSSRAFCPATDKARAMSFENP